MPLPGWRHRCTPIASKSFLWLLCRLRCAPSHSHCLQAEHDGKPFFPKLVDFLTSGAVVVSWYIRSGFTKQREFDGLRGRASTFHSRCARRLCPGAAAQFQRLEHARHLTSLPPGNGAGHGV